MTPQPWPMHSPAWPYATCPEANRQAPPAGSTAFVSVLTPVQLTSMWSLSDVALGRSRVRGQSPQDGDTALD